MKQLNLFIVTLLIGQLIQAQSVGIGTTLPNSRAQLDVVSTTKGLLIPRMTSADRLAIPSPVPPGLMVYETTSNSFWYYNGTSWVQHVPGTSPWTVSSANIYNSNTGNVGIGTSANINEKLTVKGDVLFAHPSGSNSVTLSLMANTNNQARINFIRPDSSVLGSIYSWDLNDNLHFQQSSNTNQLVLNDNGFVGIRTNLPTEALDVVGSIRSRDTITADDDLVAGDDVRVGDAVIAGGIVSGSSLQTAGNLAVVGIGFVSGNFTTNSNLSVGGTSTLTGNVTTNSDLIVNNSGAILQLRNGSNVNKGFFQISGDDVRFGTNSGNTGGDVILRMDGSDQINYEKGTNGIIMRMYNGAGASSGVLQTVTSGNRFSISNPIANGTLELGGEIFINNTANSVGIGTSTPSQRLHVIGNAYISGGIDVGSAYIDGNLNLQGRVLNNMRVDDTLFADYGRLGRLSVGSNAIASAYNTTAIGSDVLVNSEGSCAITDGSSAWFNTGTTHRMYMRFENGYRIWTENNLSTGVFMNNGDNSWSSLSDSTQKENFNYADGKIFLQKIRGMKLGSWNYKTQDKKQFRHYGPMAQEFYTNFGHDGIGKIGNDTSIATADIDGVMMIALQALIKEKEALNNNYEKQAAEINKLKENERLLLRRLEKIEATFFKNPTIANN